jgi:hypothetical protein
LGYLNGTRLPNWFWIAIAFFGLGFQVTMFLTTNLTTKADLAGQAAIYEKRDIERTEALRRDIQALDEKVDRRTKRINEELGVIGQVTRYVARKVE